MGKYSDAIRHLTCSHTKKKFMSYFSFFALPFLVSFWFFYLFLFLKHLSLLSVFLLTLIDLVYAVSNIYLLQCIHFSSPVTICFKNRRESHREIEFSMFCLFKATYQYDSHNQPSSKYDQCLDILIMLV